MAPLPLEGLRIADLSRVWAGPHCTAMLADMGAEVIKIEPPNGDPFRGLRYASPGAASYPDNVPGANPQNRSGLYNQVNRNKYGIVLDLTKPEGAEVFKKLVKVSDAVVENYGYGVMERFGLGYDIIKAIKPDIVMISMPAFGNYGPEVNRVGLGVVLEPLMGLSAITGYTGQSPMRSGVDHVDIMTALHAAGALLAALLYRRRTGKGQFIDLSHLESAVSLLGEVIMDYSMNRRNQTFNGNRHSYMAPHGCYRCKGEDEWVTIAVSSDEDWGKLCRVAGHQEWAADTRFAGALERYRHQDELNELIEIWTREHDKHEVMSLLQAKGIAAGAVMTIGDIARDRHLNDRGFLDEVKHPEAGTHPYMGPAWKMSASPLSIRQPAPCLREHREYVFKQILGMSDNEIETLALAGLI